MEWYLHQTITLPAGQQEERIDKFLRQKLPSHISRTRIQVAIKQGNLLVNEKPTKSSYQVRPLDIIKIFLPHPPRSEEIQAEKIPLEIVYEDDSLLVVNKEAPMVVHPAHGNWSGTLVNALLHHLDQLPTSTPEQKLRPGLVHRLDKGTSGLLVIAKKEESLAHLARQFFKRTAKRQYLALVWGDISEKEGRIEIHLKRHPKDRRRFTTSLDGEGKNAITHFKVLRRWGYVTLISCTLETGRTHQIRVHMQHLGHPLFGDERYGGDQVRKGPSFSKYKRFIQNNFQLMPHQALHATSLSFVHPRTGKKMQFEVPPPENFQELLGRWDRYLDAPSVSPEEVT